MLTERGDRLAPADIERRRPVWRALSELFVELPRERRDHLSIARTLRDSGYDDATLRRIWSDEVAPVCGARPRPFAGEREGFDAAWLEEAIGRNLAASALARWLGRGGGRIACRTARGDLEAVMAAVARLRKDPASLSRALAAGAAAERIAAAQDLAFLGREAGSSEAVAALGAASADEDPALRAAAVEALWRVLGVGALPPAVGALADPDLQVQRAALRVLADAARDPAVLERERTLIPPRAVEAASAALRDRDARVRAAAAAALGALAAAGADGALEPLLAALGEPDDEVRAAIAAAIVLAAPGQDRLATVRDALADPLPARRRSAAEVLALVAAERGARARWALHALIASGRDRDPYVRARVACAVGWMRGAGAEARRILFAGLQDEEPPVRAASLQALARVDAALGSPPLPLLLEGIADPDARIRAAAFDAVSELGALAAPALPRLEALSRGRDERSGPARAAAERIRAAVGTGGALAAVPP